MLSTLKLQFNYLGSLTPLEICERFLRILRKRLAERRYLVTGLCLGYATNHTLEREFDCRWSVAFRHPPVDAAGDVSELEFARIIRSEFKGALEFFVHNVLVAWSLHVLR
jgi:hypothetical protein